MEQSAHPATDVTSKTRHTHALIHTSLEYEGKKAEKSLSLRASSQSPNSILPSLSPPLSARIQHHPVTRSTSTAQPHHHRPQLIRKHVFTFMSAFRCHRHTAGCFIGTRCSSPSLPACFSSLSLSRLCVSVGYYSVTRNHH